MGMVPPQVPYSEKAYPYSEDNIGLTTLAPSYRVDLRNPANLDRFYNANQVSDWSMLSWEKIGRPYRVEDLSQERIDWEQEHQQRMSVQSSWEYFNRALHEWFIKDVPRAMKASRRDVRQHFAKFQFNEVKTGLGDMVHLSLWNYIHRVTDGVWDPRGKRALFQGLDLYKPRILFLGAAEGYEAMQLSAMYPDGEIVLVDYDEYCKTDRFGSFPTTYPFLGANPATGSTKVWYKDQMEIQYIVDDIRNLTFGKEFDVIMSVGLLEHFPDELKPEALDWHRRFLKPGGYTIITTPRNQWRSRVYYKVMADVMNYMYRELMTVQQLGLYIYENGFDILRHGFIKAHNGIVAQPR